MSLPIIDLLDVSGCPYNGECVTNGDTRESGCTTKECQVTLSGTSYSRIMANSIIRKSYTIEPIESSFNDIQCH